MSESKVKNKKETNKTKDDKPCVSGWQKKERKLMNTAHSIMRVLGEQNIEIRDVDRVFDTVKYLIGSLPLTVGSTSYGTCLVRFEGKDEK